MPNKKRLLIIVSIIFGLSMVGLSYAISRYESPEDCFVREMREWSETEGITEKTNSLLEEKDSRLAVAKAKTILNEYTVSNTTGDGKKVYLRTATLLEYCKVK